MKPTIFYLIGVFTLIRLFVAPSFGLGVDEAHYVLYGHYVDLSYVDHPPLVGWTQAFFAFFIGEGVFAARLSAILLMAFISWESYRFLREIDASEAEALWGVSALNSAFMFGAFGLMLLPDTFLLALIFPIMNTLIQLQRHARIRDFILLGVWLGLAGLGKYSAVLFLPPIMGYLLIQREWRFVLNPRLLWTILVGLVSILPVIVWNVHHEWVSFVYQSAHVTGGRTLSFSPFIRSLGAQWGAYNPFLVIIALYGVVVAWRSSDVRIQLALWIGLAVELFFIGTSFLKPVLPHWPALFYLLFIPMGVVFLLQKKENYQKLTQGVVIFSLMLSGAIHLELWGKWGKFPDYSSPFRDIYGYESQVAEGVRLLNALNASKKALVVTNWSYGSRLDYYALPYHVKTFVLDDYNRQFALWENGSPIGYDLIILKSHFSDSPKPLRCEETHLLKTYDIWLNGGKVDTIEYIECKNYTGMNPF